MALTSSVLIYVRHSAPSTMPLTPEEYERLLDSVYAVVRAPENVKVENQSYDYWLKRVHAFFQLMRWSGLSITDTLTLPREKLVKGEGGYHRVEYDAP